jgi:hypothetical protein
MKLRSYPLLVYFDSNVIDIRQQDTGVTTSYEPLVKQAERIPFDLRVTDNFYANISWLADFHNVNDGAMLMFNVTPFMNVLNARDGLVLLKVCCCIVGCICLWYLSSKACI